ncbi:MULTISPECIES: hypothetical protein [unclassified Spiroplasma]|uniref:hypothetical protein n=1 Tax=unclassified Spiroplasma TaxID=2637901 RepID=UPI00313B6D64
MKKTKIIIFAIIISILILMGFLLSHFFINADINIIKPQPNIVTKSSIEINFLVKNNLPLLRNILPKKISISKNEQKINKQRLVDIIFYYQVPLYYFQPLVAKKLLQVIYNDITIELEPFSQDIAKVYIEDVTVSFLQGILKLERRIINDIVNILLSSLPIEVRWQILEKYLQDSKLNKYYEIILQLIWV